MEKKEKEERLLKDLNVLTAAIEVLQRRQGEFFNFGNCCKGLLDEERKILQELADSLEEQSESPPSSR